MADFTAAQIVDATGGRLLAGSPQSTCSGISTDSRAQTPGHCFLALRGERHDGHDFVPAALQAGAAGLVVSRATHAPDAFVVLVPDTLKALGDLARQVRGRFDLPVIGITGSTGKTTTKEMTAAIVVRRGPVALTPDNYNNQIGVPLALLSLEHTHRAAVIEMAMRGPGEIAYLARLARPTIGVITNIGLSHLERLGSPDAIADAKGELIEAVSGAAVLNADDPYFGRAAARARGPVVSFGLGPGADYRAAEIEPDQAGEGTTFRLIAPAGDTCVRLAAPGHHLVVNALAAAAAAAQAGATLDDIAAGLGDFAAGRMRSQLVTARAGFRLLNDCYNASPASVEAALELLGELPGERKVVILGDMLELGVAAPELHRAIGEQAASLDPHLVIAVGELGRFIADGARGILGADRVRWTARAEQAAQWALAELGPGDVVLVKASRAMAFERISRRLADA